MYNVSFCTSNPLYRVFFVKWDCETVQFSQTYGQCLLNFYYILEKIK